MRTGIDVIETERISLDEKFMNKIANKEEIEYVRTYKTFESQVQSLAGLWAVKEAVMKLLDLGQNSGVGFKNIELCHKESGKPYIKLNGIALERFKNLNLKEIEVSISHIKALAIASAVAI